MYANFPGKNYLFDPNNYLHTIISLELLILVFFYRYTSKTGVFGSFECDNLSADGEVFPWGRYLSVLAGRSLQGGGLHHFSKPLSLLLRLPLSGEFPPP